MKFREFCIQLNIILYSHLTVDNFQQEIRVATFAELQTNMALLVQAFQKLDCAWRRFSAWSSLKQLFQTSNK